MNQDTIDISEVVSEIKQEAQKRRDEGEYPDGLEIQLDHYYNEVVTWHTQTSGATIREMEERLRGVNSAAQITAEINTDSSLPGGEYIHKIVAKAVSRQVNGVVDQLKRFAFATEAALDTMAELVKEERLGISEDERERRVAVLARIDQLSEEVQRQRRELNALKNQ